VVSTRLAWVCVAVALAWLAAAPAAAELCPKCKGMMYIQNIGKCKACGGPTSSGAFKLCKKCSAKLGQCEHCRAPLKKAALPTDSIVVDEKANGKTVTAEVGKLVVVKLAGNPTTGYSWTVKKLEGKALEQVGKLKYEARKVPRGMAGSGGKFLATFKAVGPGKAAIEMAYARPWEKGKPPIRTFKLAVVVARPIKK
jgi:inhibitor of cysteine peptidase